MLKTLYRFLSPKYQNFFFEYKTDMRPRFGHGNGPAHRGLLEVVESHRDKYEALLNESLEYIDVFHSITKSEDDSEPHWNNGFLPGLDIVMLYTLLRHYRPKLYVEIGSGNSTKVVRKAIIDGNCDTQVVSIDPYPRASIDSISDKVHRVPLEELKDDSIFKQLDEGDILFIDNSHRCLPNSDVTVCFLEVLPLLKKGVIVHIHDIYIPFDYPQFMCDRFYSEQYGLAFYLLANPERYRTIFPCFFVSEDSELSQIIAPIWEHPNLEGVEKHGGSFWLQVN